MNDPTVFGHRWWFEDEMNHLAMHGVDVRIARTAKFHRPELAYLGKHIAIDDYCVVTTRINLGDYIHIAPLCSIIGGADSWFNMGDFTTLAAGVRIVCASDEYKGAGLISPLIPKAQRDNVITRPVIMHTFSSIASNCVISPGVILGEGAVVGANSYVKTGTVIPAWQIWAGSPARFIGIREQGNMKRMAKELGYDCPIDYQ